MLYQMSHSYVLRKEIKTNILIINTMIKKLCEINKLTKQGTIHDEMQYLNLIRDILDNGWFIGNFRLICSCF